MIDLHNHTTLCNHALGSMDEYIQNGIKKGISVYGFSEHAPMEFDKKYRMKFEEMDVYEAQIDELCNKYPQITILKGYEVDFTPMVDERVLKREVDYLIGSIHFLDNWGFDNPEFLAEWKQRDVNDVYEEYFEEVIKMVKSGLFDIVGHLDLIKVFGFKPTKNISSLLQKVLQEIKKAQMVVEINSAGFRKDVKEIYPSVEILEMMKEYEIDITFGSDAHNPKDVGFYLKECYNIAKKIGWNKAVYFKNKQKFYKEI